MKLNRVVGLVLAAAVAGLISYGNKQLGGDPGVSPTAQQQNERRSRQATPGRQPASSGRSIAEAKLPTQARQTLALIRSGGPFPFRKDGTVFQNRERRLPSKNRGYYREYTVKTPGAKTRGAKRLVAGGKKMTPSVIYFTNDHYRSFLRVLEANR